MQQYVLLYTLIYGISKKQLLFVFDIFPRVWVTSQMNKETPKDGIVLYEININKMSAI